MDDDTRDEINEATLALEGAGAADDDTPSVSRKVRQKRRTRARS